MNAVTGFIAIVSLLLALAAGTASPQPQAGANCQPGTFGCGVDGEKTDKDHKDVNHNETLVRHMAPTVGRMVAASSPQ